MANGGKGGGKGAADAGAKLLVLPEQISAGRDGRRAGCWQGRPALATYSVLICVTRQDFKLPSGCVE